MSMRVNEVNKYCKRMNEVILSKNNLVLKRRWNLDTNTYMKTVHLIKRQKKCRGWLQAYLYNAMTVLNIT